MLNEVDDGGGSLYIPCFPLPTDECCTTLPRVHDAFVRPLALKPVRVVHRPMPASHLPICHRVFHRPGLGPADQSNSMALHALAMTLLDNMIDSQRT